MTDHILSAALTFALLAGGTAAIGSELLGSHRSQTPAARVARVTLPTVQITTRRPATTAVLVAATSAAAQRVQ